MGLEKYITTGKKTEPPFFVIHGAGGVGKTTLAAGIPGVFFLDTEGSTSRLDVARAEPRTYKELIDITREFLAGGHSYRYLAIDTMDWAERLATAAVCVDMGISDPQELAYGKAWGPVKGKMNVFLNLLELIHWAGYGIICLAHSKIERFVNPLGEDYLAIKIKCRDTIADFLREKPTLVGYMHKPVFVAQAKEKSKAIQLKTSVLSCYPNVNMDSKNRFGIVRDVELPEINGWAALVAACKGENK